MAAIIEKLTSSGGTESANFLNDIVEQLWPNINVAAGRIIKETVEPILASSLPGPLDNLRFTKIELGNVPLRISAVEVHKVDNGGIKLDMDVTWEGLSDIALDGKMVPELGIERIQLKGRLAILLAPLVNVIPLIGAAQVAFINPPELKLHFTGAAEIADWVVVDKAVRKVILNIIGSMAVLPNRYLVKLDSNNDYFKTYLPHLGALRVTVEKATNISIPKEGIKGFFDKIIKDVPDCYCKVRVGAGQEWRTSTKKNEYHPEWNETHDFFVADDDQRLFVHIFDDDRGPDDDIGLGSITIKELLLAGGTQELPLTHNGTSTDAKVTISAKFYHLVDDASAITLAQCCNEGEIIGLATVLIASALGLQGRRDELTPSVQVKWGAASFCTAAKSYSPGMDIFNPSFDQAFQIPLTADLLANPESFKIALLNGTLETGSVEIPFEDVLQSPGLVKEENFDVGSGAVVRASISLRGLQLAP